MTGESPPLTHALTPCTPMRESSRRMIGTTERLIAYASGWRDSVRPDGRSLVLPWSPKGRAEVNRDWPCARGGKQTCARVSIMQCCRCELYRLQKPAEGIRPSGRVRRDMEARLFGVPLEDVILLAKPPGYLYQISVTLVS